MKKLLITSVFCLISFNLLATEIPLTLTQEQICEEYVNGNTRVISKKYVGKQIKFSGVVKVSYFEGSHLYKPFITLGNQMKNEDKALNSAISFHQKVTLETEDKYLELDGKNLMLLGKINSITSEFSFLKDQCSIQADLIEILGNEQ